MRPTSNRFPQPLPPGGSGAAEARLHQPIPGEAEVPGAEGEEETEEEQHAGGRQRGGGGAGPGGGRRLSEEELHHTSSAQW